MKTYHITIKNNKTGEIKVDIDTCAIIGAFDLDEDRTENMGAFACNASELLATASAAMGAALEAASLLPDEQKDFILEHNGLKRKKNFLEKIFGRKESKA